MIGHLIIMGCIVFVFGFLIYYNQRNIKQLRKAQDWVLKYPGELIPIEEMPGFVKKTLPKEWLE